ncbi:MAG: multicopper oxidase domain-containing protein [Blastocatellia bacterium]
MSKPHGRKPKQEMKSKGRQLTRRTVLKLGAAAGAGTILGPTILTSRKSTVHAWDAVEEPVLCGAVANPSPPHTPFLDNLPVPSPAIPQFLSPAPTEEANTDHGEAARDPHQRWDEFTPAVTYQLEAKAGTHQFHSNYLPSYIWGFNGQYPGPTILNAYGVPSLVRFKNSLPETTSSFGTNQTTVHLHNGHTASESDGFAGDFFDTGLFKDNHYANAYAGIDDFGGFPKGDPREGQYTYWYHDHLMAETANNNYLGMHGAYLSYDQKSPPWEFNTEGSNRLPAYFGITDFPLILGARRFCPTNTTTGRTELFQVVGSAAPGTDKFVVNGKIQPKLSVRRRKYRFRIINTGVVLPFTLSLHGPDGAQKPMTVVASDGNLLREPADSSATSGFPLLEVHVASRMDVVIDFSQFSVGQSVYLKENVQTPQFVSNPTPPPVATGVPIGTVVMRFDVVGNAIIPDTPPIPSTLTELPPIPAAAPGVDPFEWGFRFIPGQPDGNNFRISHSNIAEDNTQHTNNFFAPPTGQGGPFDPFRVDHAVLKGSTEEWVIRNDTLAGSWLHPVHIHLEEGRVLQRTVCNAGSQSQTGCLPENRTTVAMPPWEDGNNSRRDVYPVPGQHRLRVRLAFRDFVGRYLIHCHNMNHEDAFMMVRWDVVESMAQLRKRREEINADRVARGDTPLYRKEDLG